MCKILRFPLPKTPSALAFALQRSFLHKRGNFTTWPWIEKPRVCLRIPICTPPSSPSKGKRNCWKPQTENPLRFSKAFHLVRLALDDDRWSSRTPQKNMYNPPANGYSAPLLKQETTIDSEIRGILSLFKFFFSFFFYIRLSFRARLWKISSRSLKTCRETKNSRGKARTQK